jgi:DNA-binding XRE family transcriptional regulator
VEKVLRVVRKARLLRHAKGLTLKDVAGEVGIADTTLSNFEAGRTDPSPKLLKALADFYNVPPAELMEPVHGAAKKQAAYELREDAPSYATSALARLSRGFTDEQMADHIATVLKDQEIPWRERLGAAREFLRVLEARHPGE